MKKKTKIKPIIGKCLENGMQGQKKTDGGAVGAQTQNAFFSIAASADNQDIEYLI